MNNLPTTQTTSIGLLNLESFELSQRIAKMLAASSLVPEQYREKIKVKGSNDYQDNPNGIANCVIALNMASRLNADPLMVMQNLYLIEGRPAWSSQFILASLNSCGRFSALRFELEDLGEKEVEYTEFAWSNGTRRQITKKITIHDMACVAYATERETGERIQSSKISIEMAVKEGWYTKNGSKWQTMPEQMLRYRAASFFGRIYAPEILMGLKSVEEEHDIIDVTPVVKTVHTTSQDIQNLKRQILTATRNEIDELKEVIANVADDVKRDELQQMLDARLDTMTPKEEKPKRTRKAKSTEQPQEPEIVQEQKTVEQSQAVESPAEPAPQQEQPQAQQAQVQTQAQPQTQHHVPSLTADEYLQSIDMAKDVEQLKGIAKMVTLSEQANAIPHEDIQRIKMHYAQRHQQLSQATAVGNNAVQAEVQSIVDLINAQNSYANLTVTYREKLRSRIEALDEQSRNYVMNMYQQKMNTF